MFKNRFSRIGIVAAAAAVAVFAGGAAYAAVQSQSLVSATATDTVAFHTGGAIYLSSAAGVEQPIVSISLPAGQYVLGAFGNLVNYGPSDYARCQIVVNGTQIAATSTVVGDPGQAGNVGPAGLLSTVTLTGGTVVGGAGATATLQCAHDYGNATAIYFDNAGSLWAHQTKSLSVQSF